MRARLASRTTFMTVAAGLAALALAVFLWREGMTATPAAAATAAAATGAPTTMSPAETQAAAERWRPFLEAQLAELKRKLAEDPGDPVSMAINGSGGPTAVAIDATLEGSTARCCGNNTMRFAADQIARMDPTSPKYKALLNGILLHEAAHAVYELDGNRVGGRPIIFGVTTKRHHNRTWRNHYVGLLRRATEQWGWDVVPSKDPCWACWAYGLCGSNVCPKCWLGTWSQRVARCWRTPPPGISPGRTWWLKDCKNSNCESLPPYDPKAHSGVAHVM